MCHLGGRAGRALTPLSAVLLGAGCPRGEVTKPGPRARRRVRSILCCSPCPAGRILSFSYSPSPGMELGLLPPRLPGAARRKVGIEIQRGRKGFFSARGEGLGAAGLLCACPSTPGAVPWQSSSTSLYLHALTPVPSAPLCNCTLVFLFPAVSL